MPGTGTPPRPRHAYDAVNVGQVDAERLRRVLAGLPLARMFGGRIVLAIDASPWLRPDNVTSS
ncbi:transposase [Pseudonocardia hispaniensis]|uniref:Transposase n=1 Tax=Pseudonocardia hispaniensis TaxID=904933 RepID=A0ABW1J1S7_9PSEU